MAISTLFEQLSNTEVFNKINETDRLRLIEMATYHRLDDGEFLSYQGNYWPMLIFIKTGALKWVLLSESGKEYTFFTLEPGNLFWGHTLFDDLPMPASLVAEKSCEIVSWKRESIKPILSRYPEALWEMGRSLVGIMRRNREVVINLAFRQVTGRLAKILLDKSKGDTQPIERDFTLDEIATMAATSQEVICRVLYTFQDQEILKVTRAQIIINDRDALEELI